ncbi:MAG TPA: AAA family ATPase [Solirubrobacter sp.]|nr:AAA family ATPase [Solirubrobacter sp.]
MDPVLRTLLAERLAASELDAAARNVIEVACDASAPPPASDAAPPVWLKRVTVEGFRGIGAPATLALDPSPGLTVVVGRNGSGKSSFAEGLELLMTGRLKRWEKRPKAWTETWQCLHHDAPTRLSAELAVADHAVTLTQTWPRGAAYDSAPAPTHAWTGALTSFRPFLAYAELATMFDTLSSLYDALTPVLGLGDVDELATGLAAARLEYDNQRKAANAARDALLGQLDPEDGKAALLHAAIAAKALDLDAIAQLLDAAPEYADDTAALRALAARVVPADAEVDAAFTALRVAERAYKDAAATDAARATRVAELLRRALAVRDPGKLTDDCPVCGTPDVLDASWADRAEREAAALEEQAQALTAAQRALAEARRGVERVAEAAGAGEAARGAGAGAAGRGTGAEDAGREPAAATRDTVRAAAAALRERVAAAQQELARRDTTWQQVAARAGEWLEQARAVAERAPMLKALKDAEKWLKPVAEDLRRERFAPISEQAVANWRELRQGSSVDLHEITLKKAGRGGRADFDVRADGEGANALGVMSQGELLALSVSVFLPRAALDESPFRFAVIDDPVQAMDPAKVDGLARVLHRAAKTRQIVVFTHDDRLPEAIRRLRLDATMLRVDRRARSTVDVQASRSPVQRYLDGARGYARPARLPEEVQARVVPMFCRNAVEAAAAGIVRRRAAEAGTDLAEADERLQEARTLRETLALAIFDDAGRHGDVAAAVKQRYGPAAAVLVAELNRGAHGNRLDAATLKRLPDSTRDFIHALTTPKGV